MYGEYAHTIDSKGRMFLPAKFRSELGEKVYLAKVLDECICIYPVEEWNNFIEKLNQLPPVKVRHVKRKISSTAVETDVDCQGRVLVPVELRDMAKLGKSVTVIGVGEKAEIWDTETFNRYKSSISSEEIEAELIALGM